VNSSAEAVNERLLRAMAQRWDWREQLRMWEELEVGWKNPSRMVHP